MEVSKQQAIEHWKSQLCDLIPYDSPNYEKELQEAAEIMYEAEMNGIFDYKNNEN